MGNPELLKYTPGGRPVRPPAIRALWLVYQLRCFGEKLAPDVAMRTGKLGILEFHQPLQPDPNGTYALLCDHTDRFRNLERLDRARLVRMTRDGMLLHGRDSTIRGGDWIYFPQAWWCVVHSAAIPRTEKAPSSPEARGGIPAE